MSDLIENPEASAFVSYPPENIEPDSETSTNHDVTSAPANVTTSDPTAASNPSTNTIHIKQNPARNHKSPERLTY